MSGVGGKDSRIQGLEKNKFSARISYRSILEFSNSWVLEFFLVPLASSERRRRGKEEAKRGRFAYLKKVACGNGK